MNKILLSMLLGLFISSISIAQTIQIKKDTVITESTDKYKVVTNHFFDNTFFGAGAGAQMYFGDHNKQIEFGDRVSTHFNAFFGKWFSPGVGVRVGVNGFKLVGATQNGAHSTGEKYEKIPWEGYWLYYKKFNFYHLTGDVLFNFSNIIGGYKPDRFYQISPFVGLGWMVTNDDPKQKEISANLGIFNSFRLSDGFDLTLDIRGGMVNDRFDGEEGGRKEEGHLAASLGLVYKFKRRGWERPKTTVISYDDAEIQALLDRLKQLSEDNDALRNQLANAKDTTITNIDIKKNMLAAPILVTFPINKSTVSNEARVNLGFFAKIIKETDPQFTYSITGYADKGTGTPAINERLSRERADAIYNVLVKEFGVNPNQLSKSYKGGVENMYYDDPRLSRAVITIADILLETDSNKSNK